MSDDDDRTVVQSSHRPRPRTTGSGRTGTQGPYMTQMQGMNALPAGTQLGEFEILDLIGEGGFGIVYLAYDHSLDRRIALKEYMPSGLAQRTQAMLVTVRSSHYADTFNMGLKSFVNEARMLARFDSPSLVKVHRFWEANGTAYMVMPYYEGITLKQAVKEGVVVPDEAWIRALLANLLDAIGTIHAVQCYHRDIAPDNILLLKDGRPLLLDFGAARRVIGDLTQGPTVILKPGFAPVEQYADIPGLRQGPWTDIYALGAVVYYLITGKPPSASIGRAMNDDTVPAREAGRGRYSEEFLETVDRMLAVRPEHRIRSVAELRDALSLDDGPRTMPQAAAAARPTGRQAGDTTGPASGRHAEPAGDVEWMKTAVVDRRPMPERPRRGKGRAVAAGLFIVAGVGAGVMGYRWWHSASTTPAAAEVPAETTATEPMQGSGTSGTSGSVASGSGSTPVTPSLQIAQTAPAAAPPPVAIAPPTPAPATTPATARKSEPAAPVPRQPPAAAPAPKPSPDDEMWRVASGKDNRSAYETYLKQFPNGKHAPAARVMLDNMPSKKAEPAPAPPAVRTEPKLAEAQVPGQKSANKATANDSDRQPHPASGQVAETRPKESQAGAGQDTAETTSQGPSSPPPAPSGPSSSVPPVVLAQPHSQPKTEPVKPAVSAPPPKTEAEPPTTNTPQRTFRFPGQTMVGSFTPDPVTGVVSGTGQIKWDDGRHYEGRLVKGMKEGRGKFTWANGQQYNGDWVADKPNGKGVLLFANGNRYEGDVRDGEPNGRGTTRFRNGDVYTGDWVKGKQHGQGRYTWSNGNYWEGEFKDGIKTENGQLVRVEKTAPNAANAGTEGMQTDGNVNK